MNQEEIRKQFELNVIKDSKANGDSESCTNALIQRHKNGKYLYAWQEDNFKAFCVGYQAALASKQDIKQGLDDIQLSMSMFANKEGYLKACQRESNTLFGCVECEWEGLEKDTDVKCCHDCGSECLILEKKGS